MFFFFENNQLGISFRSKNKESWERRSKFISRYFNPITKKPKACRSLVSNIFLYAEKTFSFMSNFD